MAAPRYTVPFPYIRGLTPEQQYQLEEDFSYLAGLISPSVSEFDAIIDSALTSSNAQTHQYKNLTDLVAGEAWATTLSVGVIQRQGSQIVEPAAVDLTGRGDLTLFGIADNTPDATHLGWDWRGLNANTGQQVFYFNISFDPSVANITVQTGGYSVYNGCYFGSNIIAIAKNSICYNCIVNTSLTYVSGGGINVTMQMYDCTTSGAISIGALSTLTYLGGSITGLVTISSSGTGTVAAALGSVNLSSTNVSSILIDNTAGIGGAVTVTDTVGQVVIKGEWSDVVFSGAGLLRQFHGSYASMDATGPIKIDAQATDSHFGRHTILRGAGIRADLGVLAGRLQCIGVTDSLITADFAPLGPGVSPYSIDAASARSLFVFGGVCNTDWIPGTNLGVSCRVITECSDSLVQGIINSGALTGPPGPDGEDGADGIAGGDGDPGPPGATGATGSTGATGPASTMAGPPGADGADGEDGAPGNDGRPGKRGAAGLNGPPADDAPEGEQGPPGDRGPIGPKGKDGKDGAPGADGEDGVPGNDGADGAPGADGAEGPQGPPGEDGEDGPPGPPGPMPMLEDLDWKSWTPAVSQAGAITTSVLMAKYAQLGSLVIGWARVRLTTAGSAGNDISMTVPVPFSALHSVQVPIGLAVYAAIGGSGAQYKAQVQISTALSQMLFRRQDDATTTTNLGTGPSFAIANLDTINVWFVYIGSTSVGVPAALLANAVPSGSIQMFGSVTPPSGWLLCDGSAVSRTTYSDLFATIGTTFGVGDGSTTFNLPSMTTRFPIGISGVLTIGMSSAGSQHQHTLSAANAQAQITEGAGAPGTVAINRVSTSSWTDNFTESTATVVASSASHSAGAGVQGVTDNADTPWPPYLALPFIIKT